MGDDRGSVGRKDQWWLPVSESLYVSVLKKFLSKVKAFSSLLCATFVLRNMFHLGWADWTLGRARCKRLLFFLALKGSFPTFLCRFEVDYILCKDFWFSLTAITVLWKPAPAKTAVCCCDFFQSTEVIGLLQTSTEMCQLWELGTVTKTEYSLGREAFFTKCFV